MSERALPLAGIRVVEFVHMVMGPPCGLVLADLGAEVVKVEPVDGDNTRRLTGSGAGFFAAFNRNLAPTRLPDGKDTLAPLLPLAWDGDRLPKRLDPPNVGEHTAEMLACAGVSPSEIDELIDRGVAIRALDPAFPRR